MASFRGVMKKILNSRFYRPDKNLVISYKRFLWANPVMCVINTVTFTLFMCQVWSAINKFFGFIGPDTTNTGLKTASFVGYTIMLLFYVYINYLLAYKFFKTDEVITGGDAKKTHITKRLQRLFLADLSMSSLPLIPLLTTLGIWLEWKKNYANYQVVEIEGYPETTKETKTKKKKLKRGKKTEPEA